MRIILPMLLAGLCAFTPAAATWREASSDHFVIYSEDKEPALRQFATRLELYDSAMRRMHALPDNVPGKANRVTVYEVSSINAVQRLFDGKSGSVAGFYLARAGSSVAIVPRDAGDGTEWTLDAETVLRHEYAHHFLFQNFAAAYPAWFSEGFAEFYSTARFDKDGSVGLGLPARHRGYGLLQGNPLPVERMMALGVERLNGDQVEALYGRGWLLTHYLIFEKSRKGQLDKYLLALNSGKRGVEAATSAFGELKTLGADLDAYFNRKKMSYLKLSASLVRTGPISIREVTPGEGAMMRIRIRSRRGVDDEGAKALVPLARRLAEPFPGDPAAQSALAEAEYDAGNYRESEAAADRALARNPNLVDALIYKGMARAKLAAGSSDPAAWKEVRHWFVAANRIDPDNPEPLVLFYRSFGDQGIPATANAVIGLERAFALAPQDRDLRLEVARQFLVDGKSKEARAALASIAFDPHGGEEGNAIAAVIDKIDRDGAAEALKVWDAQQAAKSITAS